MNAALPSQRLAQLGQRLAARAQRSVSLHRDYHTLRREDRVWIDTAPGCRHAALYRGASALVGLWELDPGTALPWPEGSTGQEILVVRGAVEAVDGAAVPARLDRHAWALRNSAAAGTLRAAPDAPAQVYVRQLAVDPATLPEPEAQWWRLERAPLQCVLPHQRRWRPTFPGVEVMPLWGNPAVTSMLVRFAPGAGVPDHQHAVHEDCLMLEGEMFLGDILLRPGDYQLAPAGGGHFGEMSDVGGTFFFHGAIDPVLVPAR